MQKEVYEVYELLEPDGHVFYVGSGNRARKYEHESDVRRYLKKYSIWPKGGFMDKKNRTIASILVNNEDIIYTVVFATRDRKLAFLVECERINIYGLDNLTNKASCNNYVLTKRVESLKR